MAASNISVSVRVRPRLPEVQSDFSNRLGDHDSLDFGEQIVSIHGSNVCLSKPSQHSLTTSTSVSSASLGRKIRNRYSGGNASSYSKTMGNSGCRPRSEMFAFDTCYHGDNNSQQDVFRDIGEKAVCSTLDGFNCCVFAYGQTASGKTFTMFGSEDEQGLTPRVLSHLLSRLTSSTETSSNSTCFVKMGYLEIYNEKVRDLLGWRPASLGTNFSTSTDFELPSLKIREHPTKGVFVQGLTMHDLHSFDDACGLITQGNRMRVIGSTNVNEHSSRSHAIIIVKIIRRDLSVYGDEGALGAMCGETSSKLHLVDLAGSERIKHTGATNKRMKEGISINQSLANLGKTISLLVEFSKMDPQKRQAFHIPYRNSSLTFLLKDSLGGNSKTFMIATISGAPKNYTETRNTLLYASRARKVVNKPIVNQDVNSKLVDDLKKEVECLKRLLAQAELANQSKKTVSVESSTTTTTEKWIDNTSEQENIVPGSPCCVHSKLMQEQLQKDEKELVDLLEQSVSPRDSLLFSPELPISEVELDTHEFGPPFICRVRCDSSTNVLQGMYFLTEGETKLGSDADKVHLLLENEPGIQPVHCSFFVEEDSVCLIRQEGAFVSVNGTPVMSHEFISHGCEIQLFETCVFTFSFPSQLASRLLREQHRSSSRNSSLFSPPMTASSCSSDAGGSRPLSELFIDIPARSENLSYSSPEHASAKSLPCTSFNYEHDLLSTASNSFHAPRCEDKSQQTDMACCEAFERLETLQKVFMNTFDSGLQEVLIGHEAVRDQIDTQLDLIRCDNRKMALLEQKLYAEVEEELASFNKARHDLLKEREYLQKMVDEDSSKVENFTRQTSRIKTVFKEFPDCFEAQDHLNENISSSLDELPSYRSSFHRSSDTSIPCHHNSSISLLEREELLKQAKSNRSCLVRDVHTNMVAIFQNYLKDMQKKQSLQLSLYRNEKKLAEVDRELSSISEKCHWLCSYCEKLREYFEAERTSMRDLEKKVGRFCCETKRELDSREDAMIQTKLLIQRNMAKSCPTSPQKSFVLRRPPESNLCKSADNVFLPTSSTGSNSSLIGCRTRKRTCKSLSKFDKESNDWSTNEFVSNIGSKQERHGDSVSHGGVPSRDDADLFLHSSRDRSDSSFSISSLPMQNMMPSSFLPFRNFTYAGSPELVSVAVPRFRRRKSAYNYFHEYQIDVSLKDETWTVFHRFSALRDIHLALKSKYAELKFLDFPPRKAFGSRLERVAAERRVQLQQYLQSLVLLCMSRIKRMRMQGYSNASIACGVTQPESMYREETLPHGQDLFDDGMASANNSDDLCCPGDKVNRSRDGSFGRGGFYGSSSDDRRENSHSLIDKQLLLQILPFLDPKYFNSFYSSVAVANSSSSSS